MTSRIYSPRTRCPGCREEVYLEELVEGCCPLCGSSFDEIELQRAVFEELPARSEMSWMVFQFFLYRRLEALGAEPGAVLELVSRLEESMNGDGEEHSTEPFEIELPTPITHRIIPKKCSRCGRLYMLGGRRLAICNLKTPVVSTGYCCPDCSGEEQKTG
jgi:hypothetical protein